MPHFLPITLDEVHRLGWDAIDIVLVSGDAYIDHPSFGTAVLGRMLEREGYRVAIIAQPNWRDDLRDFRKYGAPRLFFGVTSGVMDSMVNHYTAARRLRHDDAYTPGGEAGFRPDRATYVYSRILKQLYPDVPVVIGGIEASMRRLAHYDYWCDRLRPSILVDSGADLLTYGMGELPVTELSRRLIEQIENSHPSLAYDEEGYALMSVATFRDTVAGALPIPQTATLHSSESDIPRGISPSDIVLHTFEQCIAEPRLHAANFHQIEEQSNSWEARRLIQKGALVEKYCPATVDMTMDELDMFLRKTFQ